VPAPIVDAQVHTWLRPTPAYPWAPGFLEQLPAELAPRYTGADRSADELIGMMDEAGVQVAVLVSPWLYGADHSYAFDAAERFPGRFVVVGPVTLPGPVYEDRPHGLGPRIFLGSPSDPTDPVPADVVDDFLRPISGPVFVSPMGRLDEVGRLAGAHPDVTLVLDHAGLWLPAPVERRLELLPDVLKLADHPNVLVKCTALPELSAEPYPYRDLWRILHPLLAAFGAHRLMWGSDINQHRDRLTYRQSLDWLRDSPEISDADRAELLGGTAARLLGVGVSDVRP
jgi:predicted TIM-barrel fold metal-dependent hydrolase